MISRDFIKHRLLPRVDIVKLIDTYCKLKRSGTNYSCCCPFHKEKTPSFFVSPSRQTFKCFGCGVGGSAIDFIEKYKNLNFVEAIEELSRYVGIEIEYEQGSQAPRKDDRYLLYYELMDRAASYFTRQLRAHDEALSYFKDKRGLSETTIVKARLGFAPNDYTYTQEHIARNEDEYRKLIELGLQVDRFDEDKQRQLTRPFFRNRVMFPIFDIKGRIIAFGGRQLGEFGPKYLNTPETPIFKKRRELFGLYECLKATRNRPEKVVVVEGYMDAIALRQAGFDYVVATLGTAITADHFNLLFRYTSQVICCFDGDEAGKKATWHALQTVTPVLVDATKEVRFINLPPGHDPDTLVRTQGKAAFEAQIANSVSYPESIMLHESKLYQVGDPSERIRFINSVLSIVKAMKNVAMQQVTLQVLSSYVEMPFENISAMAHSPDIRPDQAFMSYEGSYFGPEQGSGRVGMEQGAAPERSWDQNGSARPVTRANVPSWANATPNSPELIPFTRRARINLGSALPPSPNTAAAPAAPAGAPSAGVFQSGAFSAPQAAAQLGPNGLPLSGVRPSLSVQSAPPFAPELHGGVVSINELHHQVVSAQIAQNQLSPAGQYLDLGPDGVPRADNERRDEEPSGEYYEGGRGPGAALSALNNALQDRPDGESGGALPARGALVPGSADRSLGLTLEEIQNYETVVGGDFTPRDLSSPVYQLLAFILQQPTIVALTYERFQLEEFLQLAARLKITEYPCLERLLHLIKSDRQITCAGIIEEYRQTDFEPLFYYLMSLNINGNPAGNQEWDIKTQMGFLANYLRRALSEPLFNRSRTILMNGTNISQDNLKELSALREFNFKQA